MPLPVDVSANLIKSLKVVQSIGDAVPHGGILKAVAGIGITILETAEKVRLNKEECADIARRAAEQIAALKRLEEDEEFSEDLSERLDRYHRVLEDISRAMKRIGSTPKRTGIFRATSVQEETKECLNKLNEAYQMYIFESSIAADNKLTTLANGMRSISLKLETEMCQNRRWDEPDEIRRISVDNMSFLNEISCIKKRGYTIRIGHARMVDPLGQQKAIIVRKFVTTDTCDDRARYAFDTEVELRRDLLDGVFARMLGISMASRRTKIIVIEAGTIVAYDHLQNLSGVEYFHEFLRIMCEFAAGYRFLREHRGSWRGGYGDVLLSAADKRLCMGGLGRMDSRWEDSGRRMWEVFGRLRDGDNRSGAGGASIEEIAKWFESMRKSALKWNDDSTRENARDLWTWLRLWIGSTEFGRGTENSQSVGEIGWKEANVWHPIPLVHQIPLAQPLQYNITAHRLRDGEWETLMGTRIGVYIRWSIDVSPGEKIRLSTSVRSKRTEQIFDFFLRSALSLAKDVQVDVCSLRQVARTGLRVRTSLTLSINPSTVYYFAYSLNRNGSVPNPPGFWSFSPNPLCSDQQLQANTANVRFHMKPTVLYNRMNTHVLSLLQDIDSHGFVPIPDIIYASNPTFSAMSESSNSKPLPQPSRNVSNADRSHSFVQSPRQGRYHKCEMSKHCDRLLSIGYLLTASPRSIHSRNSPIV